MQYSIDHHHHHLSGANINLSILHYLVLLLLLSLGLLLLLILMLHLLILMVLPYLLELHGIRLHSCWLLRLHGCLLLRLKLLKLNGLLLLLWLHHRHLPGSTSWDWYCITSNEWELKIRLLNHSFSNQPTTIELTSLLASLHGMLTHLHLHLPHTTHLCARGPWSNANNSRTTSTHSWYTLQGIHRV